MLLQRHDSEIGNLALVLVEQRGIEIADPIDGQAETRGLPGIVGYLKFTARDAKDRAYPRRRVDDAGDVTEPSRLRRDVMNGVEGRRRVFDALGIVQHLAGCEIVDPAGGPAIFRTRLKRRLLAAIERKGTAGIECTGLGLDVDDAGSAQPVLRRQRAGDQRHRISEPGLQYLAKDIDSLGQDDAVQAELQIGVVAADMDLPE